jgi:hypothetical protein
MILIKIYIICAIAGLIYPLFDDFLMKHSKDYLDVDSGSYYFELYREAPVQFKLFAALLPVINFFWVLVILILIRFCIVSWWWKIKKKFIRWLANTSLKRGITFKFWLVAHIFPNMLTYYYDRIDMRLDQESLAMGLTGVIKKLLKESAASKKGKESQIEKSQKDENTKDENKPLASR